MSNESLRLARLEERLAWFERHVVEQDRAMLELAEDLNRLRAELRQVRDRGEPSTGGTPDSERPPHY